MKNGEQNPQEKGYNVKNMLPHFNVENPRLSFLFIIGNQTLTSVPFDQNTTHLFYQIQYLTMKVPKILKNMNLLEMQFQKSMYLGLFIGIYIVEII